MTIHTLLRPVEEEEFPLGIIPYSLKLESGRELEVVIREIQVTDEFPPGNYSLKVGLEIGREMIGFKELSFRVKGTPKPLDFRIVLSRDRDGKDLTKVFTSKDKDIYIRVISGISGPSLSGLCSDPAGKETVLKFEGMVASYPPAGEGVYNLKVSAEVKGYRPLTKHLVFSVIKNSPVFRVLSSIKENIAI